MKKVLELIRTGISRYVSPFWFSKKSERVMVPYVYASILMVGMFSSVFLFLRMAWLQYPAPVLGSLAGVIATLAGLYAGVVKLYNDTNGSTKK